MHFNSNLQSTTSQLSTTAEVMRTIFKSSMIEEAVEAGMAAAVVTAAGMVAAEGAGVRGHPGGTGNAVAATDHDHGAEIDPVEVGDVPDPGTAKRKLERLQFSTSSSFFKI